MSRLARVAATCIVALALTPTATAVAAPAKACTDTDLSGCYSYDESQKIIDYSVDWVSTAAASAYPTMAVPTKFWYIGHGDTMSWCGTKADSETFAYCLKGRTMAFGQDLIWDFYDKAGDAGPVWAVAHEWGHHIQVMRKVPTPKNSRQTIVLENQADCLAGAFFKHMATHGPLNADDLDDMNLMIDVVASEIDAVNGSRSHGTREERLEASYLGVNHGFKACNAFFPDTPVG